MQREVWFSGDLLYSLNFIDLKTKNSRRITGHEIDIRGGKPERNAAFKKNWEL
jgi:hypothetical protein